MEARPRSAYDDVMAPFDSHELRRRADDAEMLDALGRLDERWPDDPVVPDLACELAVRLGITANTAGERLRIARALRDLPEIRRAHREGRLSWDQLRWVTMFATADTDAEWSVRAAGMRPDWLRLEMLRQRRMRREQAERDHSMRELHTAWDPEKRFFEMHARLAAEQGAAVESALQEVTQKVERDLGADDPAAARRADALVALVTSSESATRPATLVVHADAEVLEGASNGERHLAETTTGVQLSGEAVRRIACDGDIRVALERQRRPVALTTAGRVVTRHQMELLRFRDRGCTFPGCGSSLFLHAHHIRHWAEGGRTALDNLTLLCGHHHRQVHEGGWTIRGRPPDLEFVDRSGRVFASTVALARAG